MELNLISTITAKLVLNVDNYKASNISSLVRLTGCTHAYGCNAVRVLLKNKCITLKDINGKAKKVELTEKGIKLRELLKEIKSL